MEPHPHREPAGAQKVAAGMDTEPSLLVPELKAAGRDTEPSLVPELKAAGTDMEPSLLVPELLDTGPDLSHTASVEAEH
jgi:hypothetical protein